MYLNFKSLILSTVLLFLVAFTVTSLRKNPGAVVRPFPYEFAEYDRSLSGLELTELTNRINSDSALKSALEKAFMLHDYLVNAPTDTPPSVETALSACGIATTNQVIDSRVTMMFAYFRKVWNTNAHSDLKVLRIELYNLHTARENYEIANIKQFPYRRELDSKGCLPHERGLYNSIMK